MQNTLTIKSDILLVNGIKSLAQAYEQISVMKMQKVRDSVLSTRSFLDHLADVFTDVKSSYYHQIQEALKKGQKISFRTLNTNGKSVSILLTANTRLYGDLDQRIFNLFYSDIQKSDAEMMIIGKVGKSFYDSISSINSNTKPYQYFEISDITPKLSDITPIINTLTQFEHVNVYYGRFQNVLIQNPTVQSVTGEDTLKEDQKAEGQRLLFAFEPSLEYILHLFETQVLQALFAQTLHESELSRHAARIKAMEDSLSNIEKLEKQLQIKERSLKKLQSNKKRIETLAGINIWR